MKTNFEYLITYTSGIEEEYENQFMVSQNLLIWQGVKIIYTQSVFLLHIKNC